LLRRLKTRGRVYAVSNGDLRSGDHMPRSITIRGTFRDVCARAYAPRTYARVRFTTRAITLMLRRIRFVISCGLMQNLIADDALGFFPRAFPCEFFEHPRKRCADLHDASRDFYVDVATIETLSQIFTAAFMPFESLQPHDFGLEKVAGAKESSQQERGHGSRTVPDLSLLTLRLAVLHHFTRRNQLLS